MHLFGDNGIISNAQNANVKSGIAALEEFLQEKYVENYATAEESFSNKLDYLINDTDVSQKYFQRAKNGKFYFVDASTGYSYYFINKSALPKEIQDGLVGGNNILENTVWASFDDLYGVTTELKIYYFGSSTERIGAEEEAIIADMDSGIGGMGIGSGWANTLGISDREVTLNDAVKKKELTITDSSTDLNLSYNFLNLTTLTLDGVSKNSLKGLDGATKITTLYIKNSTIGSLTGIEGLKSLLILQIENSEISDYKAVSALSQISKLYIIKPVGKDNEIETLCSDDKGIGLAKLKTLNYFGITGTTSYIESLSNEWSNAIENCDVTSIEPLKRLQPETKKAIKHLYLQYLNISSIEYLEDFTGVLDIRIDGDKLENLKGIQKMSALAYLFANGCNNLGKNEGTELSSTNDALAFVYKDLSKNKNTSLYMVSLRSNVNLKYVSYLDICSGIRALYLDGCTNISDISSVSDVILACGSNYLIPSGMGGALISSKSDKIDLSGSTITIADFKNLLPKDESGTYINNTKLTKLRLKNCTIVNNDKSEISSSDFTTLLNDVLGKCTLMAYLDLNSQSKLTNINFVQNMNGLKELDLRGCSGVTDLSKLETMTNSTETTGFKLGILVIDNASIATLTNIQNTISNLGAYYGYWNEGARGLHILNETLAQKLASCTEITNFISSEHYSGQNNLLRWYVLDLSTCTKLELVLFYCNGLSCKMPSSLKEYYCGWRGSEQNLSACVNLEGYYQTDNIPYNVMTNTINSLPDNLTKFKELAINGKNDSRMNLDFLSKFQNVESFERFSLNEINNWSPHWVSDISGINYLKYATNISLSIYTTNADQITFPDLSNVNCPVSLVGFKFSNLDNLRKCTKLTNLTISNSNIQNCNNFSTLTQLQILNLQGNGLEDISGLSTLVNLRELYIRYNSINNIKVLENLTSLYYLDIRNNILEEGFYYKDESGNVKYEPSTTKYLTNNIKWSSDGRRYLYCTGNNFDSFSELRKVSWTGKDF